MSIEFKFAHDKKNIYEAFYISNERCDELMRMHFKIMSEKKTDTASEYLEILWNNKELTMLEKIFMTFIKGRLMEVER